MHLTFATFVGGVMSVIAAIFCGFGLIPAALTRWPKYFCFNTDISSLFLMSHWLLADDVASLVDGCHAPASHDQ